MAEFASRGVANTGLGLGIAGTALGLMNGGVSLFGGWGRNGFYNDGYGFPGDRFVNRYEAGMMHENASKQSEIDLLKAEMADEKKMIEMYKYIDGRFREFENEFKGQSVWNAHQSDAIAGLHADIEELRHMTRRYIPKQNIVPEPMDRYNTWVPPINNKTE